VLYHHGLPHRRELHLLSGEGCAWLQDVELPDAAREQITVAIAMSESLDMQIAPLDRQLRLYARRQAGCKALMGHYGIGELTSVAILAELGARRRFSSSRQAVRYAGMDITVYESDQRRSPGHLSRQGPPALRWALYEAAQAPVARAAVTAATTTRPPNGWALTARALRSRASCRCAPTTPFVSSARRRSSPHDPLAARESPHSHRCAAASSRQPAADTHRWTA
jgi:transposase